MQAVENQRGSIVVFVTLMIVVLLIMVGLGLDTGQLTYVRNQGQAAVDAAALAAVSGLPTGDPAQVEGRAAGFNPTALKKTNDYVGSLTNQIESKNISYIQYDFEPLSKTFNTITNYSANINTANGVRVALEKDTAGTAITTPVFLTPLMNLFGAKTSGTQDVNVSAVAVISPIPTIPIAIWQSICNGGNTVSNVIIRQQNPGNENSCWTTYLVPSSGANDVKNQFRAAAACSGTSIAGKIDVGTPIHENKGEPATDYELAEKFFLSDYFDREWLIPVIAGSGSCNSTTPTPIVDWAKIKVTDIHENSTPRYIKADVTCNQTLQQPRFSLCFSQRLVREHQFKR